MASGALHSVLRHRFGIRGHNARHDQETTPKASAATRGVVPASRKAEVVLRLFGGETLDALSEELGATAGRLAQWCDEALTAMQAGLQCREPDHRDGFIHDLRVKVGDQAMQIELLERKI